MTDYDGVMRWLNRSVSGASLAAFRIIFGLIGLASAIRFAANGWIQELFIAPPMHFSYPGFEWVKVWPGIGMYVHFAVMGLAAACIALGLFYRLAAAAYFLLFTYAELIDQTYYLNHYYFMSLAAFVMIFLPADWVWSLDNWRKRREQSPEMPFWPLALLRAQLGLVYFFAGAAKIKSDWLFRAEPLQTWLQARTDFPLIGELFSWPAAAFAMSWAGMLFDLTIAFWLLNRRTRLPAYGAVILFHLITGGLFNIGLFPWIMTVLVLVFFEPDWPLRVWNFIRGPRAAAVTAHGQAAASPSASALALPHWGFIAAAVFLSAQALIPLRHHLYPGNLLWTEEGFNFAWHVMIMEKSGQADFVVRNPVTGRQRWVSPEEVLTPMQARVMSSSPPMIHRFAHWLAEREKQAAGVRPRVFAQVRVSLNGRVSQPLVDSSVDLAAQPFSLAPSRWILPMHERPDDRLAHR
ncbi:MAG: hypothetical protein GMKNLPBB_03199 [Myxococcota bacterium]|nr:hypothetical protein [Myxococcota bacterium]